MYAIASAGITHKVTKDCYLGRIRNCGCKKTKDLKEEGNDFKWDCDVDVATGMKISRRVMEDGLLKWDAEALMNRHNSDLGRRVCIGFCRYVENDIIKEKYISASAFWRLVSQFLIFMHTLEQYDTLLFTKESHTGLWYEIECALPRVAYSGVGAYVFYFIYLNLQLFALLLWFLASCVCSYFYLPIHFCWKLVSFHTSSLFCWLDSLSPANLFPFSCLLVVFLLAAVLACMLALLLAGNIDFDLLV